MKLQKPEYHNIHIDKPQKLGQLNYSAEEINQILKAMKGTSILDESLDETSTNAVTNQAITKAINEKQDILVSGTNIKTVNGSSVLGSGDIEIGGSTDAYTKEETDELLAKKAAVSHTHTISDVTGLPSALDAKADESELADYLTTATASTTYATKTELSSKADASTTYTKTEVDTALNGKQDALTYFYEDKDTKQALIDTNGSLDITCNIANYNGSEIATQDDLSSFLTTADASTTYATKTALETTDGQVSDLASQVADKIDDASSDDTLYGRKNGEWAKVLPSYNEEVYDTETGDQVITIGNSDFGASISISGEIVYADGIVDLNSYNVSIGNSESSNITWFNGVAKYGDNEIATTDQLAYDSVTLPTTAEQSISLAYTRNTEVIVPSGVTSLTITPTALNVEVVFFVPSTCSTTFPTGTAIIGSIESGKDYSVAILNGKVVVGNFDTYSAS